MTTEDIQIYKQKDLVLNVNQSYDPSKLDLSSWDFFIEKLCLDRQYQKDAIKNAIIFLASNRYKNTEDLVEENYNVNSILQAKYPSLEAYQRNIQLKNKLFATIDLATGSGKSYVIYGIAQIMLGLGLVDKVLVLCPSLTIETGLKEKFDLLSGDALLKKSIPTNATYQNPSIVDANVTVTNGSICVENIHAVYERTGSSIKDSFKGIGDRVLVLNDESHHIFNKVPGNTNEAKGIKLWKKFLLSADFNFKYILGFTGTAYHVNDYFNDIIYRYSLREAIEDRIVKNIKYLKEDDSNSIDEKFQKIYSNHCININLYPKLKPISILITKDIKNAKNLREDLIEFLTSKENSGREVVEGKVLIVTSDKDHKANVLKLKTVDEKDDPIEWIISVSMLTEGWDVKNVFQIVPWEDKAFNSKLLIAQVLGRGLRIPKEYSSPQPIVVVFNHESWSKNIKALVNEILEFETRIISEIIDEGDREKYHFNVYNLDYTREEKEVVHKSNNIVNYSRLEKEGIKLDSQVIKTDKITIYVSVNANKEESVINSIEAETWTINQVIEKLYDEFKTRDWEGKILQLGKKSYTQKKLPTKVSIRKIILKSMNKVGITGDRLILINVNKILTAFATLLRKTNKTVVQKSIVNELYEYSSTSITQESSWFGNFRRGHTLFYTNDWQNEVKNKDQRAIIEQFLNDDTFPKSAEKVQNQYLFKTPLNVFFTNAKPEREFVINLCTKVVAEKIDCWIKSRDSGFYGIEYSIGYGSVGSKTRKRTQRTFNPDFFITVKKDDVIFTLVIEIKANKDVSDENKAKYKSAKAHFERLNKKLKKKQIKQEYIFHFLSPDGYKTFFDYLKDGKLLKGQSNFRCKLENLLEDN